MQTSHSIIVSDSRRLTNFHDESVDLVVTSPPYPMIEMWDGLFSSMSKDAASALASMHGNFAFEAMHLELDKVWAELNRVLKPGSFACINIGDAVRTIGKRFQLYPNHSRVVAAFQKLGFDTLPAILWRKQTNAPNKFMGSGMLPAGAYVTLEHEFILVFRKGGKREFKTPQEKARRTASAYFWEERNKWFSDMWDFKGAHQDLANKAVRARSAAFPLDLPYRLITMYSLYEDVVLDPFMGAGTTGLAAIACGRSSVGVEIDKTLSALILQREKSFLGAANRLVFDRIERHLSFAREREQVPAYLNKCHGIPVVTRQEMGMKLFKLLAIKAAGNLGLTVTYAPIGKVDTDINKRRENAFPDDSPALQTRLPL
jgi:modification methylase